MDEFDAFRQTFFQECDELLASYEEIVERLDAGGGDGEDLNALFRAVHSMKAGAGAFGFTRMVRFTHEFETVLDLVRSGAMSAAHVGAGLFFEAGDVLHAFVRAARAGQEAEPGLEASPLARLAALLEGASSAPAAAQAAPVVAAAQPAGRWTVRFRPLRDLYSSANDPQLLLRALSQLGDCTIEVDASRLPPLAQMDVSESYLAFTAHLVSSCKEAAIREIFEFVEDECELTVTPAAAEPVSIAEDPAAPARVEPLAAAPEAAPPPVAAVASAEAAAAVAPPAAIRVDLDRIDRLVDMVGELVIAQSVALDQISRMLKLESVDQLDALHDLTLRTRQLQEGVMAIRMQPLKVLFSRYPRIVRELSRKLGKQVRLDLSGELTEVDKTIIEELADPLTHMIRNAIDHGVEDRQRRDAAGKPEEAVITLSAEQRNGRILIRVRDDGKGLDPAVLVEKAAARGLIPRDANLSKEEAEALIFLPGFSTAAAVSDLSGRGVGMDVVRRNIQKLGGRVSVDSRLGEGTQFTITLPLTLAVLDGMLVAAGGERYIVPLTAIIETICPKPGDMRRLPEGGDVLNVRGEIIRLLDVGGVLQTPTASSAGLTRRLVVCCESEFGRKVGLVVDQLLGQQQVVVKSIETNYRAIEGVAGTAILGDGRVSLILDIDGLVSMSARRERAAHAAPSSAYTEGEAA